MNATNQRTSRNLKGPSERNHHEQEAASRNSRGHRLFTPGNANRAKAESLPASGIAARSMARGFLQAALLCMSLTCLAPDSAAASTLPSKPQAQSESSKAVQPQVDKQTSDAIAQKRKVLLADATAAIAETESALKALEDGKKDMALKALADATGKLELIVAREPTLALAPVGMDVVTHDLFASPDTVRAVILEARNDLDAGNIQNARRLVDALASDIELRTTNIPLATYPAAIKAITPLIDAGKINEARTQLQAALNTLVITTDVIPLPKVRAESLLKEARKLAEKKNRSQNENDKLAKDLASAREQLQLSELLGYGKKNDYKPMQEQLEQIAKQSANGKSGTGWFDKIEQQLSKEFEPLVGAR